MDYSGSDLVIVVPLWRRTTNLDRLSRSVLATVPDAEAIYVVNRDDDDAANPLAECVLRPGTDRLLVVEWPGGTTGDYARKINAGYRGSVRPVVFTGADDIEFTDGWYDAARSLLDTVPNLGGDTHARTHTGVVGTVDDCNPRTMEGTLSTHSLVARWYADVGACVDVDHTIYCELYPHEYVDDELCETARSRHAYRHAHDSVVRHHHPNVDRAPMDETYERGRANTRVGRALFRRRRQLWNPNAMPGVTTVRR
jgi:hypothetical protein